MSTTFTTALSTTTTNNHGSIRKRRTRIILSQLYHYVSITYNFICALILPRYKITKKIPKLNTNMQYYKAKTLILDLDETLVHSVRLGSENSFKTVSPSIIRKKIEVQCDKQSLLYEVYKRPHVDFFLKTVSLLFCL